MEFEARSDSQSFCLFYAPAVVAGAWASLEAGWDPDAEPVAPRAFPNVVFTPPARMSALLSALHAGGPEAGAEALETRLLLVLAQATGAAMRHRRLAARVPAAKPATKAHVIGLLERAREAIVAADGVGVGLDALAAQAGLSKFHFLRLFKAAYGQSPLALAEQRRMDAAARRLRAGAVPVIQLAADVGYESPSAFARAFRRRHGLAPTAYRAASN
jgi:AraC-like DNA-binding protein